MIQHGLRSKFGKRVDRRHAHARVRIRETGNQIGHGKRNFHLGEHFNGETTRERLRIVERVENHLHRRRVALIGCEGSLFVLAEDFGAPRAQCINERFAVRGNHFPREIDRDERHDRAKRQHNSGIEELLTENNQHAGNNHADLRGHAVGECQRLPASLGWNHIEQRVPCRAEQAAQHHQLRKLCKHRALKIEEEIINRKPDEIRQRHDEDRVDDAQPRVQTTRQQ